MHIQREKFCANVENVSWLQVKADLPRDTLQKQYPQIKGFHYVSSLTGYVSKLNVFFLKSNPNDSNTEKHRIQRQ